MLGAKQMPRYVEAEGEGLEVGAALVGPMGELMGSIGELGPLGIITIEQDIAVSRIGVELDSGPDPALEMALDGHAQDRPIEGVWSPAPDVRGED